MRAFFAVMPFAVPFAICRSLCRSLYAVRCAVRYVVRAGLTLEIQIEREDFPRWIFMAPFLLKTRKAKDSSRRSLMVISGRMLRQLMGDQVVTSESSRPAACFAMAVRTGLTLSRDRASGLPRWMDDLWHRSCYKIHKDGNRRWSSLEECSG